MVQKFVQPDYGDAAQTGSIYPTNIDKAVAVLAEQAAQFAVSAQDTPNLTVAMRAGRLAQANGTTLAVAAQNSAALTAPATNPRNDVIYYDATTGAIGVAAGTEAASPVDPAIPANKVQVARIRWTVGMASIANSVIDDMRAQSIDFRLAFPGLSGRFARFQAKSAAYTAVLSDNTSILRTSNSWTLSVDASANLGNGWGIIIYNDGSGIISIDPNGSETVNGATTLNIPAGYWCALDCDGANLVARLIQISTKPCAAGYTRVAPNLCMRTTLFSPAEAAYGIRTNIPAPAADATAIIVQIRPQVFTDNAVGVRFAVMHFYQASSGGSAMATIGIQQYEFVATPSQNLTDFHQVVTIPMASPYYEAYRNPVGGSAVFFQVRGYYD